MIPFYQQINQFLLISGNLMVFFGFYCYYKTYKTDPGTITTANSSLYYWRYEKYIDEIVYYSENKCWTCKFDRPARSKHCSLCKKCVARHDHHCIWIQGCVGQNNYKYFLGFIISHAIFCFIGFLVLL